MRPSRNVNTVKQLKIVRKLLRFLTGVLLLPFTVAVTLTAGDVLQALNHDPRGEDLRSVMGLIIGLGLWIFLYFVMPRPVRTYVLGHELTHALWGWIMGARVKKLHVSGKGGSIALSRSNFIIELAPYFFPFYTVLVILLYAFLSLFFDLRPYEPFWLGCIGLSWAFHLTFTISALAEHQPDIQQNGRLFSYTLIYSLNLLGLTLWVVAVSSPTLNDFVRQLLEHTIKMYYEGATIFAQWSTAAFRQVASWGQSYRH